MTEEIRKIDVFECQLCQSKIKCVSRTFECSGYALHLASWVALGKLLNFSVPGFLESKKGIIAIVSSQCPGVI